MQESLIKIIGLFEDFSESLLENCQFKHLDLDNWYEEINEFKPCVFLVQETWEGFNTTETDWNFNYQNKIKVVLDYCQKHNIKTVFLSNHTSKTCDDYNSISEGFDTILTSDYESLKRYKQSGNHSLVSLLPFTKPNEPNSTSLRQLFQIRFNYALQKLGLLNEEVPGVSIITCTNRNRCQAEIFQNYNQQEWTNKELIIILNKNEMDITQWRELAESYNNVRVYQLSEEKNLGECMNYAIGKAKHDYIAKFDDDDFYGPYYLTDIMPAFKSTKADIIGKEAFFMYLEHKKTLALKFKNKENQYVRHIAGATMVFKKKICDHVHFNTKVQRGSDTKFLKECVNKGFKLYSANKYKYVCIRKENLNEHTWKVNDKELLRGASVIKCKNDYRSYIIR